MTWGDLAPPGPPLMRFGHHGSVLFSTHGGERSIDRWRCRSELETGIHSPL